MSDVTILSKCSTMNSTSSFAIRVSWSFITLFTGHLPLRACGLSPVCKAAHIRYYSKLLLGGTMVKTRGLLFIMYSVVSDLWQICGLSNPTEIPNTSCCIAALLESHHELSASPSQQPTKPQFSVKMGSIINQISPHRHCLCVIAIANLSQMPQHTTKRCSNIHNRERGLILTKPGPAVQLYKITSSKPQLPP
jgi:hypothetical protein